MEIPCDDLALRRAGWICLVGYFLAVFPVINDTGFSTKLDAEKRLALQEEKQALEAKLLDVYVIIIVREDADSKGQFCFIVRRWKPD